MSTASSPEATTLEQLRGELLELMAQENTHHHRMGEIYNHIVAKKLAEKAGFKDARDYFTQHLADLAQSSLTMYGAVAAEFSKPVARRFGVTCLYLLLGYKEAADVEVNADDLGPLPIEVPDEKGHVTSKPFSQCSVEEMRRALRRKRMPASSKPLPPEVEAQAEQFSEAVMDFKSIPVDPLRLLAEAILSQLPPTGEEPKPTGRTS